MCTVMMDMRASAYRHPDEGAPYSQDYNVGIFFIDVRIPIYVVPGGGMS